MDITHKEITEEISKIKLHFLKNIKTYFNNKRILLVVEFQAIYPTIFIIPYSKNIYNLLLKKYNENLKEVKEENLYITADYFFLRDSSKKGLHLFESFLKTEQYNSLIENPNWKEFYLNQ